MVRRGTFPPGGSRNIDPFLRPSPWGDVPNEGPGGGGLKYPHPFRNPEGRATTGTRREESKGDDGCPLRRTGSGSRGRTTFRGGRTEVKSLCKEGSFTFTRGRVMGRSRSWSRDVCRTSGREGQACEEGVSGAHPPGGRTCTSHSPSLPTSDHRRAVGCRTPPVTRPTVRRPAWVPPTFRTPRLQDRQWCRPGGAR